MNAADKHGWTALHLAAETGRCTIVALLLEQCDIDVSAVTRAGKTAFDYAREGHHACAQLIASHHNALPAAEPPAAAAECGDNRAAAPTAGEWPRSVAPCCAAAPLDSPPVPCSGGYANETSLHDGCGAVRGGGCGGGSSSSSSDDDDDEACE